MAGELLVTFDGTVRNIEVERTIGACVRLKLCYVGWSRITTDFFLSCVAGLDRIEADPGDRAPGMLNGSGTLRPYEGHSLTTRPTSAVDG